MATGEGHQFFQVCHSTEDIISTKFAEDQAYVPIGRLIHPPAGVHNIWHLADEEENVTKVDTVGAQFALAAARPLMMMLICHQLLTSRLCTNV